MFLTLTILALLLVAVAAYKKQTKESLLMLGCWVFDAVILGLFMNAIGSLYINMYGSFGAEMAEVIIDDNGVVLHGASAALGGLITLASYMWFGATKTVVDSINKWQAEAEAELARNRAPDAKGDVSHADA